MNKPYPMNLQLFAEPARESANDPTPDGAGNQPDGDGGREQPDEQGDGAPKPATVSMTQEQLDALINRAFAKGANKAAKTAAQSNGEGAPAQPEPPATPSGDVMAKAHRMLQNAALQTAALQAGFADPSDAVAMADRASLAVDEQGGVSGAQEAVEALLAAKPHLKKARNMPPVGGGVGVNGIGGAKAKLPGQEAAEKARAHEKHAQEAAKAWTTR